MADLQWLRPDQLELDVENPRFGLAEAEGEAEALAILAKRANLRELWDSIAQKGFEPFEPLVAFPRNDRFVVVEGNRRLAAVKTLLAPELLSELKSPSPPEISNDVRATLERLPVNVVDRREDADDYIGFKHINGPATWEALAKAKFAVRLFDKTPVQGNDNRIQILTKRLGDSRQLILRSLVAFKIIEQAIAEGFLDEVEIHENSLDFSHLYTLLQNSDARVYLGLGPDPLRESLVVDNPIPKTHVTNLKYMMRWLFGGEDYSSVIKRQGTDRPKLQKVLASQSATEILESTNDFDAAVSEAGFETDSWLSDTIRLVSLSKRVSDGVTDLPQDLGAEDVQRSRERLTTIERNVRAATSSLNTLFPTNG